MAALNAYYAVFVPNDGQFSVFFPDLPGCLPWGDTFESAFASAVETLAAHLEGMADDGDPIPSPSGRETAWGAFLAECQEDGNPPPEGTVLQLIPAPDLNQHSRRINVSFKQYVLDMIDRKSEEEGMTRSGFLAKAASVFSHQQHR